LIVANVLSEQSQTANQPAEGGPPACGVGRGLTAPYCKKTSML